MWSAPIVLSAQFSLSGEFRPRTELWHGYKLLSDDDTKNKSFTPFYATNHKFNGFMDYFYVGNHVGFVGLDDIYGKLTVKSEDVTFGAHAHIFSSVGEPGPDIDKYLGTEFDF